VVIILVAAVIGLGLNSEGSTHDSFELEQSSSAGMLAELKSSYDKGEWIVVTMWSPHWALSKWDLKYLEDPEGVFGGVEVVETVARIGFADDNPKAYEIIKAFNWTQDDINSVMVNIFDNGMDDEVAAQTWIDSNREKVDDWIAAGAALDIGDEATTELQFGYVTWDGEIASTNVLKLVLEETGYTVEATPVDAGILYQSLADGDFDFTTSSWMPATHAAYFEQYGDKLDRVAVNLEGCKIGLAVPTYVEEVNSIADLKAYANEFGGRIVGIEPGAGIMMASEEAIEKYGLGPA
jgi:glycine betaine/proline transport system substrate-binding protein